MKGHVRLITHVSIRNVYLLRNVLGMFCYYNFIIASVFLGTIMAVEVVESNLGVNGILTSGGRESVMAAIFVVK